MGETGYEQMKRHQRQTAEHELFQLETLANQNGHRTHYLSQEAYKLGIKFAIRSIEGTEMLMIKAHKELPYADPVSAEREHQNTMRLLATMKAGLVRRYENKDLPTTTAEQS